MSLISPHYFGRDFWDVCDFPKRLDDQYFGLGMNVDDLMDSICPFKCRTLLAGPRSKLDRNGYSRVSIDKNGFNVQMDCSHFSPEELSVKMVDGSIVVHGKHEEKPDEHGYIKREFTRRYAMPGNVIAEQTNSSLDANGILTIKAPLKQEPVKDAGNETVIPIQMRNKDAVKEKGEN